MSEQPTSQQDQRNGSGGARRVLLKLSGESFGGGSVGLAVPVVRRIADWAAVPHPLSASRVDGNGSATAGTGAAPDDTAADLEREVG